MNMEARAAKRRRRGSGFLMEQERREGKGIDSFMQVLLRSSRNAYSNVINFDAGSLVLFSEFSLDRTPVNDRKRRYNWKERLEVNKSLNGRDIYIHSTPSSLYFKL